MWYTYAYQQISRIGGGILPPLPKTGTQIATPPEAEQLKEDAVQDSLMPPPVEEIALQKKLESIHTNGRFPVPITSFQGQNSPAAIEDQHVGTPITGNEYDDYEPTRM